MYSKHHLKTFETTSVHTIKLLLPKLNPHSLNRTVICPKTYLE